MCVVDVSVKVLHHVYSHPNCAYTGTVHVCAIDYHVRSNGKVSKEEEERRVLTQ